MSPEMSPETSIKIKGNLPAPFHHFLSTLLLLPVILFVTMTDGIHSASAAPRAVSAAPVREEQGCNYTQDDRSQNYDTYKIHFV
jgi:hypothetical protein